MLIALAFAASAALPARPPPPCAAAESRQLDFWMGNWDAEFALPGGRTGHAVNRITRDEYGDCVIAEHFEQSDIGYAGGSFSLYDSARKKWAQTWVDNGEAKQADGRWADNWVIKYTRRQ
ncbi:MAG: hypothetical protein QOJ91_251 [Sphingomonadales bacterium]|jgi:hypothetical protein|nr:hypothetical protein [Sphingomonadales bacterium]